MHIDSYQFGRIVIDGVSYDSDLIILGDVIQSNWFRSRGHLLSADDLRSIIEAGPSVLIVGCGDSGLMKVTSRAEQILQQREILLEAFDSRQAVRRFNELSKAGVNVAAAFHLTC